MIGSRSDRSRTRTARMLLMSDFFHDWRRVLGSILLVLALVCSLSWIRSRMVFDRITFAIGTRQYEFTSIGGHAWWCSWEPVTLPTGWASSTKRLSTLQVNELFAGVDREYRSMGGGWGVKHRSKIWGAAYWSIIAPLALLAACLIFWPLDRGNKSQHPVEWRSMPKQ